MLTWYLQNEPWWRKITSGAYKEWIATNYRRN
jgi:dTDP-D-glucose 4,6-dehydratase